MKWFEKLPKEKQYYFLYLLCFFGTLNCIWIAMAQHGGSIWYFLAAWCFISCCSYMHKEYKIYESYLQT